MEVPKVVEGNLSIPGPDAQDQTLNEPITKNTKMNELKRATESSYPHIFFENLEKHL